MSKMVHLGTVHIYMLLFIGLLFSIQAVPLFLPHKSRLRDNGVTIMKTAQSGEDRGNVEYPDMIYDSLNPSQTKCSLPKCNCTLQGTSLSITVCTEAPSAFLLDQLLLTNTNVTRLQITNAKITTVPVSVLNLTKLISLDFSQNLIGDPSWNILKQLPLLNSLTLTGNTIKVLKNGSLYGFQNLEQLYMHQCGLQDIEFDVFNRTEDLPPLKGIQLDMNNLESLDISIFRLLQSGHDIEINLNGNRISNFTNVRGLKFLCDPKNPWRGKLNLGSNRIAHFMDIIDKMGIEEEFTWLCLFKEPDLSLDFRGNPFECDCVDFRVYVALHNVHKSQYASELFCDKPDRLYDQKIIVVPLKDFVCTDIAECPQDCICIYTPAEMTISVNCTGQGKTSMPLQLPKLTHHNSHYILDFNSNNMTVISDRWYFNRTKSYDFGNNHIDNVSLSLFEYADYLNLTSNLFTRMPNGISALKLEADGQKLYLADNPWNCDCHFHETRDWVLKYRLMIPDRDGLLCDLPTRFKGTNILKIDKKDMICGNPPNIALFVNMGIAGGTLVGSVLVFVIPIYVLFRKRVWLYRKLKWHPFELDECEGEDKEYDVFVSYDNEDEEYVEEFLLPGLQRRDYRVCFHRVHFPPGQPIVTSIEQSICKSKRTLFVFSNKFKESQWCMWEFAVALELNQNAGTHRTIAILYDNVDVDSLDVTIRAFFKKYTYIEKDSEHFWENLQYGLPQKKMGPEDCPYPIGQPRGQDQGGTAEERVGLLNAEQEVPQ